MNIFFQTNLTFSFFKVKPNCQQCFKGSASGKRLKNTDLMNES